jgi:hypothetical protein
MEFNGLLEFPDVYSKDFCNLLIIREHRDFNLNWNIGIME